MGFAGLQSRMGKEKIEQAQVFAFLLLRGFHFKLLGGGDQFLQVFHPCLALVAFFLLIKFDQAGFLDDNLDLLM